MWSKVIPHWTASSSSSAPKARGESSRQFAKFCAEIRNKRYDIVVDFHGILKSGLVCAASRARLRIGFARPRSQEGSTLFYTKRVTVPLDKLNRSEENLRLCQALHDEQRAGLRR